jgi:hypothetical protein
MVKAVIAAVLVAAATLAVASSASAEGGCGWGYHRGPYGGCRANYRYAPQTVPPRRAVVVVPGAVIYAPLGRACPYGYHLGREGRRCWPN